MAAQKLKALFGFEDAADFPARYNAAPLQSLPVIVRHRAGLAQWGFLPPWAAPDDDALAAKLTNARSETVAEKASFRDAWARGHRCLVPANGFYEWNGARQPHYFYRADEAPLAFAGLWVKTGDMVRFTVLTKEADGALAGMHHRAPVMIDPAQAAAWFGAGPDEAQAMMARSTAAGLHSHAVDRKVGRAANDSADLIAPVTVPRQEALAL